MSATSKAAIRSMERDASHDPETGGAPLIEEGAAFLRLAAAPRPASSRAPIAPGPSSPWPRTPARAGDTERVSVVVIGAGQTGLSVGYFLAKHGVPFVILDAHARVGDVWRRRWDSLRLFTPAKFDGLAGMPFPARGSAFPTKDEMADYLEAYAKKFSLPVRGGVRVDGVTREGDRYLVSAGDRAYVADHVVVAMATYQKPKVPPFARELDRGVVQLHSSEYRNPSQLRDGPVLVVGAGNSGAEIALELARTGHRVSMSGRSVGEVPFDISGLAARLFLFRLVLRVVFHRVLTLDTPMGRKARPKIISRGGPLIRVKRKQLAAAGVELVPRVAGVKEGRPVLEDGRVLDAANVVWSTGFRSGLDWVRRPVFDDDGETRHRRGVAEGEPGLYFVGQHFLYAFSSTMIHGAARDAEHVADVIAKRVREAKGARRTG
jgi:putative flavoprotein involved in K+ transport